jgi:hypothetical protein
MTAYGPNIITNGTFDTVIAPWTEEQVTVAWDAGRMGFYQGVARLDLTGSLKPNTTYSLQFDAVSDGPGLNSYWIRLGGAYTGFVGSGRPTAEGANAFTLTTTGADSLLRIFIGDEVTYIDNVTLREVFDFESGDYVGVYYNIDEAGWVFAGEMAVTDDFKEKTFFINKTGKRIRFKFAGRGGNFQIREFQIREADIENDR